MKKVIFVCLLTLSVCLSQATESGKTNADAPAPNPTNIVPKDAGNKSTDPPKQPSEKAATGSHNETSTAPSNAPVKTDNGTIVPSNDAKGKNETTVKPTETVPTQSPPTIPSIPTTPPTNGTPSTPSTPSTASTPLTQSTTKPTFTTVPPATLQARGFDGASFVGGIILTLGLLAVGFMGFRYYKTQTERNYHTL